MPRFASSPASAKKAAAKGASTGGKHLSGDAQGGAHESKNKKGSKKQKAAAKGASTGGKNLSGDAQGDTHGSKNKKGLKKQKAAAKGASTGGKHMSGDAQGDTHGSKNKKCSKKENTTAVKVESALRDPGLCCTVCSFDLSDLLLIGALSSHPLLGVAICTRCQERVTEEVSEGAEDSCSWCGDGDGVTLLMCDEEECTHHFCTGCVERGVGKERLRALLSSDDEGFICFACEDKPLHKLHEQIQSHLESAELQQTELEAEYEKADHTAEQKKAKKERATQRLLDTLGEVEMMLDTANQHLEVDELERQARAIREEMREAEAEEEDEEDEEDEEGEEKDNNPSLEQRVAAEVRCYEEHWAFRSEVSGHAQCLTYVSSL
jgi:hypothetical protein